jgi:hypothetical protein
MCTCNVIALAILFSIIFLEISTRSVFVLYRKLLTLTQSTLAGRKDKLKSRRNLTKELTESVIN